MNQIFKAALVLSLLISTTWAEASVKIFKAGRAPQVVSTDLQLSSRPGVGSGFNRGTAAQEILRYVSSHKRELGINQNVDGETFPLRKVSADRDGISVRYIQRYNRVAIEGAELVAIHDANGKLKALNSSLVPAPGITVNPDITLRAALASAVRELGYLDAEVGEGRGDGLLIVGAERNEPKLVWQFSLREHADGSKPLQVQVLAQGPRAGQVSRALSLSHGASTPINIYDASIILVIPTPLYRGMPVLENGEPTLRGRLFAGTEANAANSSFERVTDFYKRTFARDSYDGRGATVHASVNVQAIGVIDLLGQRQNAAWLSPWKMFAFGGGGDELAGLTAALDVVGHEFTHAVISSTSDLAYVNQSGALNEHLADVFGAMIQSHYEPSSDPFLLGETVLRGDLARRARALRDMLNPALGVKPQPAKVSEIPAEFSASCRPSGSNDNCGVHILSGIPNRASALMVQSLGWEKLRKLFYTVMTQRLRSTSQFADYRNQMLDQCSTLLTTFECQAVKAAFDDVGI